MIWLPFFLAERRISLCRRIAALKDLFAAAKFEEHTPQADFRFEAKIGLDHFHCCPVKIF
jgi:hypothetical protein